MMFHMCRRRPTRTVTSSLLWTSGLLLLVLVLPRGTPPAMAATGREVVVLLGEDADAASRWERAPSSSPSSSSSSSREAYPPTEEEEEEEEVKAASAPRRSAGAVMRGGGASRALVVATNVSFPGEDLSKAALSQGNPNAKCNFFDDCVNGCASNFYKVTGGNGSQVAFDACGTATFPMDLYVWEGSNGTCASFTCVEGSSYGCPGEMFESRSTYFAALAGAEYYVQVFGFSGKVGNYALTVSSDDPIEVAKSNVTDGTPDLISDPIPHKCTIQGSPTNAPSKAPTDVANPCADVGTTYWLYNPTTNAPIRKLSNNSVTCLLHPYNLEVRPCNAVVAKPVRVRLLDATGGRPLVVHKSKIQRSPPYVLFGPAPTGSGDVLPSPKPLRNGVYYLEAKGAPEWGRLQLTQNCPCPDGTLKKGRGKKGCMK